ncbi:zinc finger protein 609-like isoform X1 [Diorhabda carinulata]|uniref:zinc finger protein 609-like isoform X1 n=1 Tax=Diorhabda carinulata TaxID=1163345 RepID=UPI0025A077DE|nr:zinc finger protein 609-like isoform X1 [Diorhabda carinulata]XP_057669112.1 zinc finger protein 609-like isoform X1 [Diorhabda carinulata]XP_057669113.1 zinc finger protein 609-like isoform X1 [Diorhabda carinulata]XP_057669114.1 zinc finger protein 609-like isoform X1 [Diorhabda carinulata]XP_057669115.1 zinc finger protein 609-like isoform X1 [Diorhabda carinulata]
MATPMRSSSQEAPGHRARVADSSRSGNATAKSSDQSITTSATATVAVTVPAAPAAASSITNANSSVVSGSTAVTTTHQPTSNSNFEYDDNEWDIGIGDLIIDLDADIEKTNDQSGGMAANAGSGGPQASKTQATAKMHIEHSATADKGLKMKIKRTKPGTKTSEAKHEIVKSNEQNGIVDQSDMKGVPKHGGPPTGAGNSNVLSPAAAAAAAAAANTKRGSSGHRRDKIRDKHSSSSSNSSNSSQSSSSSSSSSSTSSDKSTTKAVPSGQSGSAQSAVNVTVSEMNGLMRVSAPQTGPPRSVFPASTGPGPPQGSSVTGGPSPAGPPPSPAAATAPGSASKPEQAKVLSSTNSATGASVSGAGAVGVQVQSSNPANTDDRSTSPPPPKKVKNESREVADVCVGTSVGTITEPDCLGPCEPGTSVTLEGIVWHETEGGVLVVNVTWRGKTYVGTLLDCTRHDWAPPRFCDSPTSDLDNRTPKGRETRSSVHSKLRNGGGIGSNSGGKGRRGGAANGSGPSTAPSSPTPFVPPRPDAANKRKSRAGEEESTPQPGGAVKKPKASSASASVASCTSPPSSPILLECPEANCSKKYKHINGLKYHQSHAHGHGSVDDEDAKDVTSMSENDESNIEAPSPSMVAVKSPEKVPESPLTPPQQQKKEELPLLLRGSNLLEVSSQPATPRSTPPSPATPQSIQELPPVVSSPTVPIVEPSKSVVKPGVLRYSSTEEYPVAVGLFSGSKPQVPGSSISNTGSLSTARSTTVPLDQPVNQPESTPQPSSFANQLQSQSQFTQPPSIIIPSQNTVTASVQPMSPHMPQSPKIAQFKVKPTSALMPEEKKQHNMSQSCNKTPTITKKKNRKSPAGSPHPPQSEQPVFNTEQSGRDEVQSPAYSDISDDGAPVIETDMSDKNKSQDKKTEPCQPLPHMTQYGMYHPFYGQHHQYLVPSATQENKPKEQEKQPEKVVEKECKKDSNEYPPKVLQQHYYPYGYVPGYAYNMEANYGGVQMVQDDKMKEERRKESPSPIEQNVKQPTPIPNPIQVPNPGKVKDPNLKDKHPNENHQILKESIEIKNQMNPYLYSRQSQQQQQQISQQQQQQQQQQAQQQAQQAQQQAQQQAHQQNQQQQQAHHNQREDDVRRFYVYSEQRRKESQPMSDHKSSSTANKVQMSPGPNIKPKDIKMEEKKEKEIKQEGVKPTMETQGPPPPPTSQYAYIHPSYMQQAHYGALPFDPSHPMYRGIMVPGPYSGSPYLHPPIQRYHAPEDLSRAPPPTKTLDMLQHHAQYYSSHKIHELQERAIKSPTPKTSMASSSPSTNNTGGGAPGGGGGGGSGPQPQGPPSGQVQMNAPPTSQSGGVTPSSGKQTPGEGKEPRSPPPQRHVHTHHHTHVGLGYPMYPAPYGAAVLASQQAAAVTVINPYPTK